MDAGRRGVNWLLVWIGIALLVGAGLVVGVSLDPGAHADARSVAAQPDGPLRDIRIAGLDVRVPADFQVTKQQTNCGPRPVFDGHSQGVVVVDGFPWGSVSSCPEVPAQPSASPVPEWPPSDLPTLEIARYDPNQGVRALSDPTKSGRSAGTRRAADQVVEVRTDTGFSVRDTLLIFTRDRVVVDVGDSSPGDPLVTSLLSSATR